MTQSELQKILHYCPNTGIFTRKVTLSNNSKVGSQSFNLDSSSNYYRVYIFGKSYYMHRLAWLYEYGEFPINNIDHIDGNRQNNKINNLRDVNQKTNTKNTTLRSDSKYGCFGVYFRKDKNKWVARITINKVYKTIGTFLTKEEAIVARKKAEAEGGFHLNHGKTRED